MQSSRDQKIGKQVLNFFTAVYGVQKMSVTYDGQEQEFIASVWGSMLSPFSVETIAAAGRALTGDWPPSLPQFVELCRQASLQSRNAEAPALPAPRAAATPEQLQAMHDAGYTVSPPESVDHLRWARNPKSLAALRMLQLGCERPENSAVRTILRGLIEQPQTATNPDVRRALESMRVAA